jgi:nucleoside-triphosphatase
VKVFLVGRPGSGKTTILAKVIDSLRQKGFRVGGIVTPEVRQEGRRVAFSVRDIHSGEEAILASIWQKTGPRISKYRVNVGEFERVAIPALDFAMKECDVVVVDELGPMEMFSSPFKKFISEALKTDKPILATVHRSLVQDYRGIGEVVWVTREGVDRLADMLTSKLCDYLGK